MTLSEVKKTSDAAAESADASDASSSSAHDAAAAAADTGPASGTFNKALEWMHELPSMSRKLSPMCDNVQRTDVAWWHDVLVNTRALAGPWKSWNNFSRFPRPGKFLKTDMVLESPWICVWRSLKVLEFDFLKRCDRISYFQNQCNHPVTVGLMLGGVKLPNVNWTCLYMLIKVPVWVNLVLRIYPLYGPWKSMTSPWIWFWQMGKNHVTHCICLRCTHEYRLFIFCSYSEL